MALDEQIRAALVELLASPDYRLPLGALPLGDLSRWQDQQLERRASEGLQKQTVGIDELAAVPHARVYAATHANITLNTLTDIAFTVEHFDQGNMVDIAAQPTRITIPRTGVYAVGGNFGWGINNAGAARIAGLRLNGGAFYGAGAMCHVTTNPIGAGAHQIYQNFSTLRRLTRGDYITLAVFADATTAPAVDSATASIAMWAQFVSNYTPESIPYAP